MSALRKEINAMMLLRELGVDVLTASRQRIKNIFSNKLPVYMSFSGGKDSLVMADITLKLAEAGEIDAHKLRVEFIDEEAIFPCVERTVLTWRDKFIAAGAAFNWYCIEVKHFSCLNKLENDESFICFDSSKSAVWIRQPPPFAIRSHPLLKPRKHTYQDFLMKLADGLHMVGLRVHESVQRRKAVASIKSDVLLPRKNTIYPIYDWNDDDVWVYLRDNAIEIPAAYMNLFQIGVARPRLRISQFFSVDTAYTLARISEYYPDLMERILKREPTAYIVALYWDSEMFGRRTYKRREAEEVSGADYRNMVFELLNNIPTYFKSPNTIATAEAYKNRLIRMYSFMVPDDYKRVYEMLRAGDPKLRNLRAIIQKVMGRAAKESHGNAHYPIIRAGNERSDCQP
jgi:predicted phosphoadenosine phosphosulfate sulfurtransferase